MEKLLAFEQIKQLNEKVENKYLSEEIKTTHNLEEIIGTGERLQAVFRKVSQVAQTDSTVLLEGETGTGKELFARFATPCLQPA